ncbi:MAG: hypothetical protein J6Y67_05800 [Lachnospiraceae bacterium]|nr:hypothetical protein [Lachnospiraceae bacterium]
MKKYPKYPIVVLSITLLLVIASLVLTFVGAFRGGSTDPLFKTGVTGIIIVPMIGWVMVSVYNRVHKDGQAWNRQVDKWYREQEKDEAATEAAAAAEDAAEDVGNRK